MSADPTVVKALGETDLFSSLSPRALRRVADRTRVVTHAAGTVVAGEGGSGIGFHLILSGRASVSVGTRQRPEMGPGDYFGEISLVDGKPRSATVTALTDLQTVSLTAWEFHPLLDEEPSVTKALLGVLCARLRAAERG